MKGKTRSEVVWDSGLVSREQRWKLLGYGGATLWFTGLSGSGKSTVAKAVEASWLREGRSVYRLDGDNIRHGLNSDLGFSATDRHENIRRIGEVAALFADAGCVAIASFISPFASDRDEVRKLHRSAGLPFYEVYLKAPLAVCEERDPKGLYRRARAGEISEFTGIDSPYQAPRKAELVLDTHKMDLVACVAACRALLEA